MTFIQYIKDKRYFFILFVTLMLFISLLIILSENLQLATKHLLYMYIICSLFLGIYLTIGFYYHKLFFQELVQLIESDQENFLIATPKPRNHQQYLYLELLKKIHQQHFNQLEKLYDEKKDHQEFILSWIHEVKTPITASRLLIENNSCKTVDFLTDKLEDELDKIDNYVEQALYYSRIDSFSKDYFITEISLDEIIKKSVKKYAKSFINKQIRFHMDYLQEMVYTDSKWLSFIIDQIVANSLKYTEEHGEVSFHVEEDAKEKRLLIQDTGIGIKIEDINRVFDKGFTGSNGRIHSKSTGMGLYLAKKMALKLGHDLSIQSETGRFTTVKIHFPKIRNYYHL